MYFLYYTWRRVCVRVVVVWRCSFIFVRPRQSCKGELLKLAGGLLLVYGRDVPELADGVRTMLGWCHQALSENDKNKQARNASVDLLHYLCRTAGCCFFFFRCGHLGRNQARTPRSRCSWRTSEFFVACGWCFLTNIDRLWSQKERRQSGSTTARIRKPRRI